MTIPATAITTPYRELRKLAVPAGVPIEHFASIPLPTRRWSTPALASFAAPGHRRPGQPMELSPPDRWWAVDVARRSLLAYNLISAVSFTSETISQRVVLSPTGRGMQETLEDFKVLDELMDRVVASFLIEQAAEPEIRQDLSHVLAALTPPEIVGWYRLLVPDFFQWLQAR